MRLIRFSSTISRNLENAARFTKSNELVKTTSAGENQDRNEVGCIFSDMNSHIFR
jgi:hypothetical protein